MVAPQESRNPPDARSPEPRQAGTLEALRVLTELRTGARVLVSWSRGGRRLSRLVPSPGFPPLVGERHAAALARVFLDAEARATHSGPVTAWALLVSSTLLDALEATPPRDAPMPAANPVAGRRATLAPFHASSVSAPTRRHPDAVRVRWRDAEGRQREATVPNGSLVGDRRAPGPDDHKRTLDAVFPGAVIREEHAPAGAAWRRWSVWP